MHYIVHSTVLFHNQGGYHNSPILQALELSPPEVLVNNKLSILYSIQERQRLNCSQLSLTLPPMFVLTNHVIILLRLPGGNHLCSDGMRVRVAYNSTASSFMF